MALQACLQIESKKLENFDELVEDPTYPFLNRGFKEDRFPAPAQFYKRCVREEDERVEWKVEKLKVFVPPREGNYFYITLENGERVHIRQKERNQYLKNEDYDKKLQKIIE